MLTNVVFIEDVFEDQRKRGPDLRDLQLSEIRIGLHKANAERRLGATAIVAYDQPGHDTVFIQVPLYQLVNAVRSIDAQYAKISPEDA